MSTSENYSEIILNVLELLVTKDLTSIPHPNTGAIDLYDALVRPLNPAPAYDYDALVRPLNPAPAFDYDALVRPLNPAQAFDYDALVRPLDVQGALGNGSLANKPVPVAGELGLHPVNLVGSGAIVDAGDIGALIENLLAALGEAKSLNIVPVELSGALAASLSSVPDPVWIALVAHLESLPDAATPVTLTEGFFDGLAQFPVQQIDVESAIQLVGINVIDAVVL